MNNLAKYSYSLVQVALEMVTKGDEFDNATLEKLNTLALAFALEGRGGLISVEPGSINWGQFMFLAKFIGEIDEHVSCNQAKQQVSVSPPNPVLMAMTVSYIKEAITQLSEQDRQPDARRNLAAPFGSVPNATILMLIIAKMHESGLFSYGELITSVLACVKFGAFPSTLTLYAVNTTALETIIGKLYKSQSIEPTAHVAVPVPVVSNPMTVVKSEPVDPEYKLTADDQRAADRARRSRQQSEERSSDRSGGHGNYRSDGHGNDRSGGHGNYRSGGHGNYRSDGHGNDRSGRRVQNQRPSLGRAFREIFQPTPEVTSFMHHRPNNDIVYVKLNEVISYGRWFNGSGAFRKLAAICLADLSSNGIKAESVKLQMTIKFHIPVYYTVEMSPPTAEGVEKLLMALLSIIDPEIITNASAPVEIHVTCDTDEETKQRAILVDELNQPYDCAWFVHYREMIKKKKTLNGLCKCDGHENCMNTDMNHLIEFHNDAAFALTKLNW
jgi:hypothetical protein